MGLREQKKDQQRGRILSVCGRLFRSRGFDETTVDEIAQKVGISRQTFFNYFPSKEAVLRELGFVWLAEQGRRTAEGSRRSDDASGLLPRLGELLRNQLRAIQDDREFMRLVFTRSGLFFPTGPGSGTDADANRLDRTRGAFELMAAGIRHAQDAGELRDDVDASQIAEIYVGVFYVTTRLWLTDYWDDDEDLETRMFAAVDMLANGMKPSSAPRKARRRK